MSPAWSDFVDNEKAWAVRVVKSMYIGAKSRLRINNQLSDEFGVNIGVHQGSVLSSSLFILVLEALSRELRTSVLCELLYADDLVLNSESLKNFMSKFEIFKLDIESKKLRVNFKKPNFMMLSFENLKDSGASSCSVCWCQRQLSFSAHPFWVHKNVAVFLES